MGAMRPNQQAVRGTCPICRAPTEHAWRPFCSKRCSDVDLARWLGGRYVIAGGNQDADEDGDDVAAAHRQPDPKGGLDEDV